MYFYSGLVLLKIAVELVNQADLIRDRIAIACTTEGPI